MICFSQSEFGTLKVTGYLRGHNLSVNGLVHIPGWGDFQMLQIDAVKDPYSQNVKSRAVIGQVSYQSSISDIYIDRERAMI